MSQEFSSQALPGRLKPWDASVADGPEPGIAVAVAPAQERVARMREKAEQAIFDDPACRPPGWTPEWGEALAAEVSAVLAAEQLPGAWVPAINIPRFVHGQSQGICDIFGAPVEKQPDGNCFVHPLGGEAADIAKIQPRSVMESMYWGAVEWTRYARRATQGRFQFRNPVMCGPLDIANYLLGTTLLMEWLYTEPDAVRGLLKSITTVIVDMLRSVRNAAGGTLHALHFGCMSNLFDLCSECRSLVSAEMFGEFDAPYLARIGRELGQYAIHSCGSWERTVPVSLNDPNLKGMNGQVRENDLRELSRLAAGRVVLSIGPSVNLPEKYTWPDQASFLEYVLRSAPPGQPLEIRISESELQLYSELYGKIRGAAPAP